ncbi:MAG: cytochrome c [Acidobacteria bacterium]|nr:cytochrome c [Acidobacteriota bacterium]
MSIRNSSIAAAALVLATLALAAAQEEAQQPPVPAQVQQPKPPAIPEAEKNRRNPVPPLPEAIESGRNLFSSQCSMCHGAKGDGKGNLVKELGIKVPDFTDPKQQSRRTDGELFYILSRGHGEMPAEKRLTEQHRWEMILYIRTLAAGAAKPKP